MADQKALFDLDNIPPVKPANTARAKKKVYVVYRIDGDGEKRYIWKSHVNGGIEWVSETELNANKRKKPMMFSMHGVKYRIKELAVSYSLIDNVGFEIWERDS